MGGGADVRDPVGDADGRAEEGGGEGGEYFG